MKRIGLMFLICCLFITLGCPTNERYKIVDTKFAVIKIDTETGKTWMLGFKDSGINTEWKELEVEFVPDEQVFPK